MVTGTKQTGTATGNVVGESTIQNGKIDGGRITFDEVGRLMGNEFRIEYMGQVVSADEIEFTRRVIGQISATEQIVVKRLK